MTSIQEQLDIVVQLDFGPNSLNITDEKDMEEWLETLSSKLWRCSPKTEEVSLSALTTACCSTTSPAYYEICFELNNIALEDGMSLADSLANDIVVACIAHNLPLTNGAAELRIATRYQYSTFKGPKSKLKDEDDDFDLSHDICDDLFYRNTKSQSRDDDFDIEI